MSKFLKFFPKQQQKDVANDLFGYKEYVATFTKAGTAAPVMTILNSKAPNFLSGIVAAHGGATGLIAFNKTNGFPEGRVICIVNQIYGASGSANKILVNMEESDVNTLYVYSKDGSDVATNGVDLAQIIIRVY